MGFLGRASVLSSLAAPQFPSTILPLWKKPCPRAMAAGLATLEVIEAEGLVQKAARTGSRLLATFEAMAERYELVRAVRGKGLMIGIEFGPPRSLKLKAAWTLLEAVSPGLFCQL